MYAEGGREELVPGGEEKKELVVARIKEENLQRGIKSLPGNSKN